MITLGMDCATDTVGLALVSANGALAEIGLGPGKHHAEVLLPALEQLLELAGVEIEEVDLIACTRGPGSFTGVRMGVTTAKGLCLAAGKPVVGVSTLEALAQNALASEGFVCPLLDARREQVYAGLYRRGPDGLPQGVIPDRLTDIGQWLDGLPKGPITWLGDGAVRYRERILAAGREVCEPAFSPRHRISGLAVALIGVRDQGRGLAADALTFLPTYLRLSEAEVKAAQASEEPTGSQRETEVDFLSSFR